MINEELERTADEEREARHNMKHENRFLKSKIDQIKTENAKMLVLTDSLNEAISLHEQDK